MLEKEVSLSENDFEKFIQGVGMLSPFHSDSGRPPMTAKQFQLMFRITYSCALKFAETVILRKKDFDLQNKILTVTTKKRGKIEKQQTTITPNLITTLNEYLKTVDDYLFPSKYTNKPITRQISWEYAKNAGNVMGLKLFKAGKDRSIRGMSLFLLRDLYKYFMLRNNADKNLVDLKLREKSETHYGNYTLEDLKKWESKQFKHFLSKEEIQKYVNWYKDKRYIYHDLSKAIQDIIVKILKTKKIDSHYITSRAKEMSSFKEKIKGGINYSPNEMRDLSGIRIICYVRSDVDKVCSVIEQNFDIVKNLSMDKSNILGESQLGYLSIHYVARLPTSRTVLDEYKNYQGLLFEIQVRTILQHAWAEIEHDRLYKYSGNLPKDIPRRFYLVAGLLESADNEFQRLNDIELEYSKEIKSKTKTGELDIPINSTSLLLYLLEKFGNVPNIEPVFYSNDFMGECIKDLERLGINSLEKLSKIIPPNLSSEFKKHGFKGDFGDIITDSLLIHFGDEYFKNNWKKYWNDMFAEEIKSLKDFGVDGQELNEKYINNTRFGKASRPTH